MNQICFGWPESIHLAEILANQLQFWPYKVPLGRPVWSARGCFGHHIWSANSGCGQSKSVSDVTSRLRKEKFCSNNSGSGRPKYDYTCRILAKQLRYDQSSPSCWAKTCLTHFGWPRSIQPAEILAKRRWIWSFRASFYRPSFLTAEIAEGARSKI